MYTSPREIRAYVLSPFLIFSLSLHLPHYYSTSIHYYPVAPIYISRMHTLFRLRGDRPVKLVLNPQVPFVLAEVRANCENRDATSSPSSIVSRFDSISIHSTAGRHANYQRAKSEMTQVPMTSALF